jgi:hypothetical protein
VQETQGTDEKKETLFSESDTRRMVTLQELTRSFEFLKVRSAIGCAKDSFQGSKAAKVAAGFSGAICLKTGGNRAGTTENKNRNQPTDLNETKKPSSERRSEGQDANAINVQIIRSYSWAETESTKNSECKPVNNCGRGHNFLKFRCQIWKTGGRPQKAQPTCYE